MIDPTQLNSTFVTIPCMVTRKPTSVISEIGCVKCSSIYIDDPTYTNSSTENFYFFVPKNVSLTSSVATLRVVPETSYQVCTTQTYIGKPQNITIKINNVDVTTKLGGPWNPTETLTLTDINLPELYRYVLPGINNIEVLGGTCPTADAYHIGNVQLFITFSGVVNGNL